MTDVSAVERIVRTGGVRSVFQPIVDLLRKGTASVTSGGVAFDFDDFDDIGADSASLTFMPLLRPDVIKLDPRLVQDRPGPAIAEIVHAVNAYAERTGALVLAEGIENDT